MFRLWIKLCECVWISGASKDSSIIACCGTCSICLLIGPHKLVMLFKSWIVLPQVTIFFLFQFCSFFAYISAFCVALWKLWIMLSIAKQSACWFALIIWERSGKAAFEILIVVGWLVGFSFWELNGRHKILRNLKQLRGKTCPRAFIVLVYEQKLWILETLNTDK